MRFSPQKNIYVRKRILVIDDDKEMTGMIKQYLEEYGQFEVQELNNSQESLNVAKQFNPDLILLDLMMPSKTGDEVANDLKDDCDLKNVPIIFLTGVVLEKEAKNRHGQIGGHVFLSKPVKLEELMECIYKHV